jgi:diguanylate cyclase (GGDEF)-like protein
MTPALQNIATRDVYVRRTVLLGSLVLLAVALVPGAAPAGVPMRFERLGLDAGLSEQSVNAIAQDPTGFLWVGTEDGLDRYDGFQFVHYTHERIKTGSLPNNFVADVRFDRKGGQWVATYGGGVVRRSRGSGEFVPIGAQGDAAAWKGLERVRVICTDRAGRLWIGTRDSGLAMFDPTTSRLSRFKHSAGNPASLAADSIYSILEDRRGAMWIGSTGGADILDPNTGRVRHFALDTPAPAGPGPQVVAILEDSSGHIWVATEDVLQRYDPVTGTRRTFAHAVNDPRALPGGAIQTLYEDGVGRLWIGTTDGLVRFDHARNEFDIYRNDPQDPESLPDNNIVSLFEDSSGLLWVGTKFGGLAKWNPRSWSFGLHPAAGEGFASHNIMAFTEDASDRLWIGTLGGGLTAIGPDGEVSLTVRANGSATALSEDRVTALLTDRNHQIWVGTMGRGLDLLDPDSLAVRHFRHDSTDANSLPADGVMSVLEDSTGRLWVGTFGGGLAHLNTRTGQFHNYQPGAGAPRISSDRITALAEDRQGRIWAGTDGDGINILDPATNDLLTLRHDPKDPRSLSSDTIYAVYIGPDGSAWIGTRGGGLDHAILRGAGEQIQLTNWSEANGLPNNTVYGIVPDTSGRLWLSTNRGLACLDPHSGAIRNYSHSHGLQDDEFNFGAHYRARNGRLLFGGASGYNEFYPERLLSDGTPPPVALTSVLLMGQALRPDAIFDGMPSLHFGYRQDVITFEYAALNFAAPQANLFEYRLAGFDRDWIKAGTRHSASYTNLPGGNFLFEVRAANADGLWGTHGLRIPITVDPPPWKTWWAYGVYTCLGALLALGVWTRQRLALEQAAAQRCELEREVCERTRELAERNAALQRANTLLEQVSFTDALTGLGNRRSLDVAMPGLIESLRHKGRNADPGALAMLLVDLDRLKPINDQFGHEAGDRMLIEVASVLKACVRDNDQVVRWGGDEFVIVHPVTNIDGAAALAERLRYSVSKRLFKIGSSIPGRTSCSIGFALYPFVPQVYPRLGWERVLNVADANLYRAKATRNAWVGCWGLRHCIDIPNIESLAADDLDSAERECYVEVRRSAPADDETVSVLVRRPATPTNRSGR